MKPVRAKRSRTGSRWAPAGGSRLSYMAKALIGFFLIQVWALQQTVRVVKRCRPGC